MTDVAKAMKAGPPNDPQQHAVYRWEDAFIESRLPSMIMSRDDVYELTMKASIVLEIPQPRLKFVSIANCCYANIGDNSIKLADWGRNPATVLHEMAHLGSWRAMQHGEGGHGSTFLTSAMALYHLFIDLPLDYLIETATSCALQFSRPNLLRMTSFTPASTFYDEEF